MPGKEKKKKKESNKRNQRCPNMSFIMKLVDLVDTGSYNKQEILHISCTQSYFRERIFNNWILKKSEIKDRLIKEPVGSIPAIIVCSAASLVAIEFIRPLMKSKMNSL